MKRELPKVASYVWKRFVDGDFQDSVLPADNSKPNIAILATSSGFKPSKTTDNWVKGRAGALKKNTGYEIYVPQFIYGDNKHSLVFEDNNEVTRGAVGGSNNSSLMDRGVSPANGVKQVIECAEAGLDIFPFMGGMSFVDKTGAIIDHFNQGEKKPEKPIRIFYYSDVSHAAFLQSHHPDIFRFYSTASSRDLYLDQVSDNADHREEYDKIRKRNLDNLQKLIKEDFIEQYPRQTLFLPKGQEINLKEIQYFLMHSDMIMADAIDFDIVRGGRGDLDAGKTRFGKMLVKAHKLNTSRPYILGFEGFLQQPSLRDVYDNNFGDYLDEFLKQRAAIGQLPVAIEMGLFETRFDGYHGYADGAARLHDERNGLIKIDDFNIDRLFVHREKIAKQVERAIAAEKLQDSKIMDREKITTRIPESVKRKVEGNLELDKSDIAAILEMENQKISIRQQEIKDICEKYGVALIMNNRHGHCLNQGVVGGGLINVKIKEHEAEIEQLPTDHKLIPSSKTISFVAKSINKKENAIEKTL